ncbi:mitochondrial import receptor subunit TOM40-1-like [Olea europaea subsp. europaea]|uniref:Mitochondrial import receptor subunit TOM40-1-like n=2 Tax=Olea europaea subsp. europaea TaxID=158383 RepID=A0A8S0V8I8_OLEEU|nr:mitochondrial import receptor subunit TOM40-1-like [Olea europaea subsp. europaea]
MVFGAKGFSFSTHPHPLYCYAAAQEEEEITLLLLLLFNSVTRIPSNFQSEMATLINPPTTATAPPAAGSSPAAAEAQKVDYMNLPCPIPYEEIHREALMSLKPELFEGMRFDFTKGLNQKFSLSHSVMMGPTEIPSQSSETIKIPTAHYEFGANFIDPKLMLFGRVLTDGRVNARLKCDLSENLTMKGNAQLTHEPHMSHGMVNFDYKGSDYRTQFQLGNGALFGASYIQSVSPHLSLGGEVFWAGQHRKSGIGYAARYNTDKMVATGQVASTGMVALSYVQKISEKVSLASDFMYNYMSRDVTASFGYDYILRQCRLRGKIDSNGCVAALLEERLNMGLNFILSAEVRINSLKDTVLF